MNKRQPFFSAASVAALGAVLALQPASFSPMQAGISLSPAFALDVGGAIGGALGADAGGSLGGTGGGVGGTAGADAGGSLGGALGDTLGGGAEAGGALSGNGSGSASGISGELTGAVSGGRTGAVSTSERGGFLSGLFGEAKATARPAERTSADAAAHAMAGYEAAMLKGNVQAAARALVQISAAPVTARTVYDVNARLSIVASESFVAALVADAQKLQARAAAAARRQVTEVTERGTAAAESLQDQARAMRAAVEARASAEAVAYANAVRAANVHAAARSLVKLSGNAATEADIRKANRRLGITASDSVVAGIAAEVRNLRAGRVSGFASATSKASGSSRGSAEASVTGRGTYPTEVGVGASALSTADAEYRKAMARGDVETAGTVAVRLIAGPITATSVQQLNARVGVRADEGTLNAVAASAHALQLSQRP